MNIKGFFLLGWILLPALSHAEQGAARFTTAHAGFFQLFSPEQSEASGGYLYAPEQQSKSGGAEAEQHTIFAETEFPVALSRDAYLRLGFEFAERIYEFSGRQWERARYSDETLYQVAAAPGAGWFVTDDLLLTGRALLGAYSDLEGGIETGDTEALGDALLVYRINPQAQLLAGAAASRAYEDYEFLPLAGLRLFSEDARLHVSVTFPLECRIGYEIDEGVSLFGGYWAEGDEYNAENEGADYEFTVRERRVGGGVSFWLGWHVNVVLEAGAFIDSELKVERSRGGTEPEGDLDPSPYLAARLGLAL